MERNAKKSGTMLDAFMMEEIVAKIPIATNAKTTWLKPRPMLLEGSNWVIGPSHFCIILRQIHNCFVNMVIDYFQLN